MNDEHALTDLNPYSELGIKEISKILKEHKQFLWLNPNTSHLSLRNPFDEIDEEVEEED